MLRSAVRGAGAVFVLGVVGISTAAAQIPGTPAPQPGATETRVSIEVIAPPDYMDGLTLQRWAQLLNELGANPQVRTGRGNEQPEANERSAGRLRDVSIRAVLDSRRRLHVPGGSFTLDQRAELAAWLDELREYGAQGSPDDQPLWGLSEAQFREVFASLAATMPEMEPASVPEILTALRDGGLPLELSRTAAERLGAAAGIGAVPAARDDREPPAPDADGAASAGSAAGVGPAGPAAGASAPVGGLSLGTSLAHYLNRHDLAFRPRRHADGEITLHVLPMPECADAWPVGWPPPEGRMVDQLQRLFELVSVEVDRVPLDDVLAQLGERVQLPILYDEAALEADGVDPHELRATLERRQATWQSILQRVTAPHMLVSEVRIDEAGRFFIWITTARAAREAARAQ